MFFLEPKEKQTILSNLQVGFFAEKTETMPTPTKPPRNYFKNNAGVEKCRDRLKAEVESGRMLGGPG